MSFLRLDGVRKRYGAVCALEDVHLSVPVGSRTAIVGPSGSGKTTLLRVIAGFEAPDAGRVTLGGDVLAEGAAAMPAHRRGVGVVTQDGALFPHLSVGANVAFGLEGAAGARDGRVAELMRLVGLDLGMLGRRPDELSGGQQQRVALARALARQPRLMLLDEPFSALDTALRVGTRKAIAALLREADITTILVTHDQAEALSFADQVAVMLGGRLLQVGTPQEVYRHPVSLEVASFLGDAIILPGEVREGWARCALGMVRVEGAPAGAGMLMLRPEQVTLGAEGSGVAAEVVDVDFGGMACTCVLRLVVPEHGLDTVSLRVPGTVAVLPGMRVGLSVLGAAHVFGGVRGSALVQG